MMISQLMLNFFVTIVLLELNYQRNEVDYHTKKSNLHPNSKINKREP